MSVFFLILLMFLAFAFITIARRWYDYSSLFTIAIGYAVNANIYNSSTTPVYLGDIVFAVDSILYTGFMFAVIICAKEYGTKKAKVLTSATLAAILLSAVIEFLAKISSFGYSLDLLTTLLGYVFSALGTFIGVWVMLYIFDKMEKRNINININFSICVLVASIINSFIYYGGITILNGEINNFVFILIGSYIGKVLCILFGLLSYYFSTHIFIPNDLKDKYTPIWKKKNSSTDLEQNN